MLDLESGRVVIMRELDALTDGLDACTDAQWNAAVRCTGWTVADLAAHVYRFPVLMGRVLSKMRDGPLGYVLRSPSTTVTLVNRTGGWEQGSDDAVPTTEIAGDNSSLALFGLGRIPADHASITVTGDPAAARSFKSYFPGP